MKDEVIIEYKSGHKKVTETWSLLDTVDKDGIVCSWSGYNIANGPQDYSIFHHRLNLTWNFDWTRLKSAGVERLIGYLIVNPPPSQRKSFHMKRVDIDWKGGNDTITEVLPSSYSYGIDALFQFHLTAHYAEGKRVSYEKMFAASEMNDTVFVVEGKKLHVNKVLLSAHSEFFRALFSSSFKEGQLTEIPIEEVSYADFALLLSTIHPKQVFPNDMTVEKLLELADRFLMPSVTNIVAHHLVHISKLSNEKMLWMADAYGMPELLEKCIRSIDTVEQAKSIERSPKYAKLSSQANQMLFRRLLQLV